ncbi:MAG TPA: phosphoribosylanthranilate isomerase [Verrucomicrobiae bacterium]|nr:phosphoribosylanthranilate isomerase [Verrucomicrobiae bacterium]
MTQVGRAGRLVVKVCGVRDPATAEGAADAGASAVGLVFDPRSPRAVDLVQARRVVEAVGCRIDCIGVFVDADADELNRTADAVGLQAVQLHLTQGRLERDLVTRVERPLLPAFSLRPPLPDLGPVLDWWPIEPVLLDAGTRERPGGTGARADWALAAIVARHRPVWLAGGLGPESVVAAIHAVAPAGVDASSGLETAPGVKDLELVRRFVTAARSADTHGGDRAGPGAAGATPLCPGPAPAGCRARTAH